MRTVLSGARQTDQLGKGCQLSFYSSALGNSNLSIWGNTLQSVLILAYLTQNSLANSHSPFGPGKVMIYAKQKAENALNLFIVPPIRHLRVGWGEGWKNTVS